MNGKTVDGLLQIIEDYREHNRELKARIETFLFKSTPIPEFWENEEKETAGADISPKGWEERAKKAGERRAEALREETNQLKGGAREIALQEENAKLKKDIQDINELSEAERTCFGCKADIEKATTKPHVCSMCECKDNWVAK